MGKRGNEIGVNLCPEEEKKGEEEEEKEEEKEGNSTPFFPIVLRCDYFLIQSVFDGDKYLY